MNMLKLERIQYRLLKIALGLMQSTHDWIIRNSYRPFWRLLAVMSGLNSLKMVREFGMVDDYYLKLVRSVYDYPLVCNNVSIPTCTISTMWWSRNRLLLKKTFTKWWCLGWWHQRRQFDSSSIFFTDASKGGVSTSFSVYHSGGSESSFRLREPSGLFPLELSDKGSLPW
jgi:hypothetical protein